MQWDRCSMQEWDIANCLAESVKGKFRYVGKNQWEMLSNNEWLVDNDRRNLRITVKRTAIEQIQRRANEWQDRVTQGDIDAPYMVMRLLQVSIKLQNTQFLNKVLRELQEFLNFEMDVPDL